MRLYCKQSKDLMKYSVVDNIMDKKLVRQSDMEEENEHNLRFLRKGLIQIKKKRNLRKDLLKSLNETIEARNGYLKMYDELKRGTQSTDASFVNKRSVYYSTSDNYSQLLELETLTNSMNADNGEFGSVLYTEVDGSDKSF